MSLEKKDDNKNNGDGDLGRLSDIYATIKQDAKTIIDDLNDGVIMWREAAAGATASAGFLVIIILFYLRYSWSLEPLIIVRWLTLGLFLVMAVVMAYIGIAGFAKYFQLRRKYSGLFEKAKKL